MSYPDYQVDKLYTKDGKDVWRCEWRCDSPMVCLKNLETGEREEFGLGGLTSVAYRELFTKELQ